jgi:hypothetical protein
VGLARLPSGIAPLKINIFNKGASHDKKRTSEQAKDALEREFGDGPPQNDPRLRAIRKRWETQDKSVTKLQKKYDHAEEHYDRSVKQLRNERSTMTTLYS